MSVVIRQLEKKDSSIYRRIRLECLQTFPDNFGSTFEEENRINPLKFESYLLEESEDNFMFGAFNENELIGICGFAREARNKTRHRGEIVQMYVNPMFAGQGIGNKLLKAVIQKAFENGEIEQIILSVVEENSSANKAYEKIGFVEYGRLQNYFKQGGRYWNQRFMVLGKAADSFRRSLKDE